jgi:hypothetical protein
MVKEPSRNNTIWRGRVLIPIASGRLATLGTPDNRIGWDTTINGQHHAMSLPPGHFSPQPLLTWRNGPLAGASSLRFGDAQPPNTSPAVTNPLGIDLFSASSPNPPMPTPQDFKDRLAKLRYPKLSWEIRQVFAQLGSTHPTESRDAQQLMAYDIAEALDAEGRKNFMGLLQRGTLFDTSAEDGHTSLYHLYGILKTPRAAGINNAKVLDHTVRILNKPYVITQKFTPLDPVIAQQIEVVRNNWQKMREPRVMAPNKPLTWKDIQVDNSATCVASSVMFYMADKTPSEFVRHIKELTSPRLAFTERAKLSELSPDDPSQAYEILKKNKILYYPSTSPDEVQIIVNLPYSAYLRTINDTVKDPTDTRTGVETAYQSALTFLATPTYDPATDTRLDFYDTVVESKGLSEEEKTLMETIIKDNGGVQSVTYQVVQGKAQPKPGEEGQPFLYGYYRTFEQITHDMLNALSKGEYIVIGITETEYNASIAGGHEITIVGATQNTQTGDIDFVVVDSDDRLPEPYLRPARELIPKIHHAGLPLALARGINNDIKALKAQNIYYIPDQSDLQHFDPLLALKEPLPVEGPPPTTSAPTPPAASPPPDPGAITVPGPGPLATPFLAPAWPQQPATSWPNSAWTPQVSMPTTTPTRPTTGATQGFTVPAIATSFPISAPPVVEPRWTQNPFQHV